MRQAAVFKAELELAADRTVRAHVATLDGHAIRPDADDRGMTSAMPVHAASEAAFFPEHGGLIMLGLYLLGILLGVTLAYIFKTTLFQGEAVPFVMELPNYRLPSMQSVLQLLWEKAKDFLT